MINLNICSHNYIKKNVKSYTFKFFYVILHAAKYSAMFLRY